MKIFLGILALLVVSACAGQLKPKPLELEENKRYVFIYSGSVVTGIPSSSHLYSGTQLSAAVTISHIVNEHGVHLNTMQLSLISFGDVIDEITNPIDVKFNKLNHVDFKPLQLTVQYHINEETQRFEWMEVDKRDEPWSLNIKKAIIEMFLVDIAGKQLKMDHDYSQTSHDEIDNTFDIHESTLKGECETMYQVTNAIPESVHGSPGIEKFYWKVVKTRNYQNCNNASVLTHHNWAQKGCAIYCKQSRIQGENTENKHDSLDKSQCSCDYIDAEPLDQQLTSTYYIESMEYPKIISAESNGKTVFDNHGTRFISYTNQTLRFYGIFVGDPVDIIDGDNAIRVSNLTFTLNPYTGSSAKVFTHEIPIYNLLVPSHEHPRKPDDLYMFIKINLEPVAKTIMGKTSRKEDENQLNIARYMIKVIQGLSHLDNSSQILQFFVQECNVPDDKLYTNTFKAVKRQLFLDAISHVGTRSVFEWLEIVINNADSYNLSSVEIRKLIETLPLNSYAPTRSLINLLEKKIYSFIAEKDWDSLSGYVLSYGKLIAKACPNPGTSFIMKDEEFSEECSIQNTFEYIISLAMNLYRTKSIRGKVLIAQALAHSGKFIAILYLQPLAKGQFECSAEISDCIYLRTSVIYSLSHLVSVAPEQVRSFVLPIFNSKSEPYELRLAAFTVFMSAGPKRHELDSVAFSLRKETNLQVISMVRSILEETASLTNPCDKPLAQAARETIATLPEVNLDGVYSQASYNEWYSIDKSTGFLAEGQFVANNVSYIPRHGYLNIGSYWKSMSNSWFSFAFQQKGLETAFKHLKLDLKSMARDPRKIDDLWRNLRIESRDEEEFMLKFFIRIYEQHSLFTMDKYTLKNIYKQFLYIMRNFVSDASNNEVDFNLVRFFMPSFYADVVPTAIGLPIMAIKQNPQIFSLRLTKSDLDTSDRQTSNSINFKITPQIFTSSGSSLSVFNQGLKTTINNKIAMNYGIHSSKKLNTFIPLDFYIGLNSEDNLFKLTYTVKPVFDKINFHSSNTNFAFIADNYIGFWKSKTFKEKRIIESQVPAYTYPVIQLKSPEFGMNLKVNMSTERPWFIDFNQIPCVGTFAWFLGKYYEINQFNHNINLTLIQNNDFPATGIVGSFSYDRDVSGEFMELGQLNSMSFGFLGKAKEIGKDLTKRYRTRIQDPAFFARSMDISLATLGQIEPTKFNSTLTLVHALDYHAYWCRFNSTLYNKNKTLWMGIPRRFVIDGKLERSVLPSDLKWKLEKSEEIIGNYITNISWSSDLTTEKVDTKILINGKLKRLESDPVIPEMERRSWFHKQCEKDIKTGNATHYACEQLYAQQAYFNVVTGKVEYRGVEKPVRESIQRVYSELKRSLMSYWKPWSTISSENVEADKDIVTFQAAFSNIIYKRPVINLLVQTPTERVNFTKIFVPVAPFPTLLPKEYLKAPVECVSNQE